MTDLLCHTTITLEYLLNQPLRAIIELHKNCADRLNTSGSSSGGRHQDGVSRQGNKTISSISMASLYGAMQRGEKINAPGVSYKVIKGGK